MPTEYTFAITDFLNNQINLRTFPEELRLAGVTIPVRILTGTPTATEVTMYFDGTLGAAQEDILNDVVTAHTGAATNTVSPQFQASILPIATAVGAAGITFAQVNYSTLPIRRRVDGLQLFANVTGIYSLSGGGGAMQITQDGVDMFPGGDALADTSGDPTAFTMTFPTSARILDDDPHFYEFTATRSGPASMIVYNATFRVVTIVADVVFS